MKFNHVYCFTDVSGRLNCSNRNTGGSSPVCVIHWSTVSQVHPDCIQTSSLFFLMYLFLIEG